jgi:hypothetical protein
MSVSCFAGARSTLSDVERQAGPELSQATGRLIAMQKLLFACAVQQEAGNRFSQPVARTGRYKRKRRAGPGAFA